MTLHILDTDHLSLHQRGHRQLKNRLMTFIVFLPEFEDIAM